MEQVFDLLIEREERFILKCVYLDQLQYCQMRVTAFEFISRCYTNLIIAQKCTMPLDGYHWIFADLSVVYDNLMVEQPDNCCFTSIRLLSMQKRYHWICNGYTLNHFVVEQPYKLLFVLPTRLLLLITLSSMSLSSSSPIALQSSNEMASHCCQCLLFVAYCKHVR